MKEKTKMKLEDIKVESFITSVDENALNGLIGGTTAGYPQCPSVNGLGDVCNTFPLSQCTCDTTPAGTCAQTCIATCPCVEG